jgi:membrane associated rhomboid family serine protease
MIPIRDDAPRTTTPVVTYFLLAINLLIYLFEATLDPRSESILMYQFGVVPSLVERALHGSAPIMVAVVPLFTSMFLHASTWHVLANMWALWIFGDNIEDHLGHFRYLILYVMSGLAASLLHIALNTGSSIPTVGASGAIAGVMGAYFMLFPSARVLTIVPFIFMFVWLPAWVVLGYWFVVQFLSGAATSIGNSGGAVGGVAVWAHVGGFIAGVTLIKLFPSRAPRYSYQR